MSGHNKLRPGGIVQGNGGAGPPMPYYPGGYPAGIRGATGTQGPMPDRCSVFVEQYVIARAHMFEAGKEKEQAFWAMQDAVKIYGMIRGEEAKRVHDTEQQEELARQHMQTMQAMSAGQKPGFVWDALSNSPVPADVASHIHGLLAEANAAQKSGDKGKARALFEHVTGILRHKEGV